MSVYVCVFFKCSTNVSGVRPTCDYYVVPGGAAVYALTQPFPRRPKLQAQYPQVVCACSA